jgi:hypothetical protein
MRMELLVTLGQRVRRRFKKIFVKRGEKPAGIAGGNQHFALKTYLREDGSFDYARYKAVQEKGNRDKLEKSWVLPENIVFLSRYLREQLGDIRFGLCHGTRRGLEQQWFREQLGCEVIGTEIAESAKQFPHTIQWDFHQVKPEWLGAVDFIYSNALDHSYDPELCINRWMSCLRPGGICIVEHSSFDEPQYVSELDPFGASIFMMPYLMLKWGKGAFCVHEILDAPSQKRNLEYNNFLIIRHSAKAAPRAAMKQPLAGVAVLERV